MVLLPGNWEAAQKVARGYLPPDELHLFYTKRAHACEAQRAWQDAERAYVAVGEVDLAVNMYKANRMWLPLLKLVQQHRRDQLPQMHLLVAQVGRSSTLFVCEEKLLQPLARPPHCTDIHDALCALQVQITLEGSHPVCLHRDHPCRLFRQRAHGTKLSGTSARPRTGREQWPCTGSRVLGRMR